MKQNYVSIKNESVRMFRNDFLESLSRVHPAVPLILYIPLIIYLGYKSLAELNLSVYSALWLFFSGLFVWTLTEYVLHRFVFHLQFKSQLGQRIHFIFHGVHHDYPNDAKRLVMPPSASIPLSALFYLLFSLVLGSIRVVPFFAGFMLGYLVYDMMHYAIHHFRIENRYWKKIKEHHMRHHFVDSTKGFGVSSALWDVVAGTDYDSGRHDKTAQENPANPA
jgi:sterol desaturase/sphingolipid hydroxylase (fatty acid hydroxylase superfamily)